MTRTTFSVLLAAFLCACSASVFETPPPAPTRSAAITTLDCLQVTVHAGPALVCLDAPPDALLMQSPPETQTTLKLDGGTITFDSTVLWSAGATMRLATLDGMSVVSAHGQTRVVPPGSQVNVPLAAGDVLTLSGPPSEPQAYDLSRMRRAPLETLLRPVALGEPRRIPTATPVDTHQGDDRCTANLVWTHRYTVQPGDTLSAIASRYGLRIEDLQTANCIRDPNLITPGDTLRVPYERPEDGGMTQLTNDIVYLDRERIAPGECATVFWSLEEAKRASLEWAPIELSGEQTLCPEQTTEYTLLAVDQQDVYVTYTFTITVGE